MEFEIYKDKARKWRWRLVANNGKIVADGGEGYYSKFNVKRAIKKFIKGINKEYTITEVKR